jgi:hypothetical protein
MSFINKSLAPADESQYEEWYENETMNHIKSISKEFIVAKKKADYDSILKKYNIKMIKNGKIASPMQMTIKVKQKIISMAINEPEDVFDYDAFSKLC